MDEEQLQIFKEAFFEANDRKIRFPDRFNQHKINELEWIADDITGGGSIRFFIRQHENEEWYLDLFAGDDFSTWHKRIHADGTIEDLENFKGEFGIPVFPDDPKRTMEENQRILSHNDQVHAILLEKGLEKNFENPEFEAFHVVQLSQLS